MIAIWCSGHCVIFINVSCKNHYIFLLFDTCFSKKYAYVIVSSYFNPIYLWVDSLNQNLLLTLQFCLALTHWGRVTHICVSKLIIIASDNGLSPGQRQAIIWTNAGTSLINYLGTNFSENIDRNSYIFIQENTFENVVCEMSAILSRPQCVNPSTLYYWQSGIRMKLDTGLGAVQSGAWITKGFLCQYPC